MSVVILVRGIKMCRHIFYEGEPRGRAKMLLREGSPFLLLILGRMLGGLPSFRPNLLFAD